LWVHEPDTFFLEAAREISEKWNFFVNRSVPENFQWENFSGQVPTESLRTQDSEYLKMKGGYNFFGPVWFWSDGDIHADVYKAKHDDDVTMRMRRKTLVR